MQHPRHEVDHDNCTYLGEVVLEGRDANGTLYRITCDLACFAVWIEEGSETATGKAKVDHLDVALLTPVTITYPEPQEEAQ